MTGFMVAVPFLLILATVTLAATLVYCVLVAKKNLPAYGITILLVFAGKFFCNYVKSIYKIPISIRDLFAIVTI